MFNKYMNFERERSSVLTWNFNHFRAVPLNGFLNTDDQIGFPNSASLPRICLRGAGRDAQFPQADLSESKITTPGLGWRQDSVIRSDSPDFGVAESFSTCADIWIVW
jgi:hypothetical protein